MLGTLEYTCIHNGYILFFYEKFVKPCIRSNSQERYVKDIRWFLNQIDGCISLTSFFSIFFLSCKSSPISQNFVFC